MFRIDLAPRVTPDVAQALWYDLDAVFEREGSPAAVLCDASAVRYLSAAAVQVLLIAQARARRQGGTFSLVSASDDARASLGAMGALFVLDGVQS